MLFNSALIGVGTLSLSFFIIIFFVAESLSNFYLMPVCLLLIAFVLIVKFRKRTLFSLMLFFVFLFPFDFLMVYFSGATFFHAYDFNNINLVFLTLSFFCSFLLFIPSPKEYIKSYDLEYINSNILFFFILGVYLLGTMYLSGGNIFESDSSYGAYRDNLKNASGLNEYLIILSCLFIIIKKTKAMRFFVCFAVSIYIFKSVIYGLRVQALMQFIVFYFMFINKDIKSKYLFLALSSGFLLMLIYGFAKEGMIIEKIGFELLVDTRYGYAQSHQQGVLSSSTAMLNYKDLFPNVFLNIPSVMSASVIPRGIIGDILPWAYPSSFVQMFQYTPGGGLFTTQIYLLLGFPGLIIILLFMVSFLNSFLNLGNRKPNCIITLLFIVTVVFFPRWISYDFFNYFARSSFVLIMLYVFIYIFLKLNRSLRER
ncbi:hypothetical protein [Aliivibrio fischeri]|uniref:hypothetical protein n=1 Tax=Aliivibrio fischeri TaxID=668 RepID=UPI00373660FA